MHNVDTLSVLQPGASAFVTEICSNDSLRSRLQAIGLINGAEVQCVRKSPLGDPVAFLIQGAVIALRCEDFECVHIQRRERL